MHSVTFANAVPKYTLSCDAATGSLLTGVRNEFGHSISMIYDSQNRLATLTDPQGGVYRYGYDSNNNLTAVTYPDGKVLAVRVRGVEFQARYPGRYSLKQLHTLQKRVKKWRQAAIQRLIADVGNQSRDVSSAISPVPVG